jgi:hypothetical protein
VVLTPVATTERVSQTRKRVFPMTDRASIAAWAAAASVKKLGCRRRHP